MPAQRLRTAQVAPAGLASSPRAMALRRAGVLGAAATLTAIAAAVICQALAMDTLGPADLAILAVFTSLFAMTAFSSLTALVGLVVQRRARPCPLGIDPHARLPRLSGRTAILAPIFDEEVHLVFGRLQAVWESVQATGEGDGFDLFILSDTSDPAVWIAEERAFEALRARAVWPERLFYRRRREASGRKAGNIADWVRRFGRAYGCMVILDADSLMTGDCLVRLADAMARNPGVGLIQTSPSIINRNSLFGRVQQFASRLYGPSVAHGLAWWSGAEGNYWGHNAIIRVRAFADHAGLPDLPGPRPFGGPIMSHDFVEAALMRRAGWAVHMAPQLGGSYEECPPTLADHIKRDRRWCQGNLQHLRVVGARGLHWVSRLHLVSGALAYLAAPVWLALLCLSVLLALWPELGQTGLGAAPSALSAAWGAVAMRWVFVLSMTFLLAPKLLAYALMAADAAERRRFGGAGRALASVVVEILVSSLVVPVTMLSQTWVLIELAAGRDAGWSAQRRSEGRFDLDETVRGHGWHTTAGLALAGSALAAAPMVLLWMSPVVLGLLVSIPLARWLACCDIGLAAKRSGLLLTPEETAPFAVLVRANALAGDYHRIEAAAHGLVVGKLLTPAAMPWFQAGRIFGMTPGELWCCVFDAPGTLAAYALLSRWII